MINSGREKIEDKIFDEDISNESYHNKLLIRLGGKNRTLKNIDFSHTYFEHCYFKDCNFDSCNFNGCKFINCNLTGSSFPGSKFDYAVFEKTYVDNDILSYNCPSWDNLKLKFARTLRLNYQSLGDSESVNKAIQIELRSTKKHLYDSWHANTSYYRNKYKGFDRFMSFLKWLSFKAQETVWGNGESLWKLLRAGLYLWIFMTLKDVIYSPYWTEVPEYFKSFINMPSIFLGISKGTNNSDLYLSFISASRLIGFGLFMSILIKKFNRR